MTGRNRPRSGGSVRSAPRTCSRADAPAPSGWTPWLTWGSWFGSPSRTIERAAVAPATAFASDCWPASSTNRTSSVRSSSGTGEQPARPGDDVDGPGGDRLGDRRRSTPRSPRPGVRRPRPPSIRWSARIGTPGLAGGHDGLHEEVRDRLVGLGRDADPVTGPDQLDDHPRPGPGLAGARAAPGSPARSPTPGSASASRRAASSVDSPGSTSAEPSATPSKRAAAGGAGRGSPGTARGRRVRPRSPRRRPGRARDARARASIGWPLSSACGGGAAALPRRALDQEHAVLVVDRRGS